MAHGDKTRCFGGPDDPLMMSYHDEEWGVPVHDDRVMFEFLTLEGFQAGLSWRTILHKREAFRRAFDNFDIEKIAVYSDADLERLMANVGIVRNRAKIGTTIGNAIAPVLKLASNTPIFERMSHDLDLSAGSVIDGTETIEEVGERVFDHVLACASGEVQAKAEETGHREFQVWAERAVSL